MRPFRNRLLEAAVLECGRVRMPFFSNRCEEGFEMVGVILIVSGLLAHQQFTEKKIEVGG